jgi:hypothetical protein
VVKVSSSGVLSAIGVGNTTVVLTGSNGVKYKCSVTVVKKAGISNSKLTLNSNKTKKISLYGTEIKGISTDDINVATISNDGMITAYNPGKAKILLTGKNGKSYKCIVTVPERTGINFDHITLKVKDNFTLKLFGTSIKDAVTDDKSVALVSDKGVVTAVGVGRAKILLTGANGKQYKCIVTVNDRIGISDQNMVLSVNERKRIYLYGTSIQGMSIDDVSIASISRDGYVTANSIGKTNIILTGINGVKYKCSLTVNWY